MWGKGLFRLGKFGLATRDTCVLSLEGARVQVKLNSDVVRANSDAGIPFKNIGRVNQFIVALKRPSAWNAEESPRRTSHYGARATPEHDFALPSG
jgi:hypothetical protein